MPHAMKKTPGGGNLQGRTTGRMGGTKRKRIAPNAVYHLERITVTIDVKTGTILDRSVEVIPDSEQAASELLDRLARILAPDVLAHIAAGKDRMAGGAA